MYSYFYGIVVSVNKRTITFDCNNKGYIINVANPAEFSANNKVRLYTYAQYTTNGKNGFIEDVYGFKNFTQKELFINLMRCNGIGPKTALAICANDVSVISQLIANKDLEGLKSCKGVSDKLAHSILEALHDLYRNKALSGANSLMTELFTALNNLGYKESDVQYAMEEINKANANEKDLSVLLAHAIKIILSRHEVNHGIN